MRIWVVGGMMAACSGFVFAACSSGDKDGKGGSSITGDGGPDASAGNGGNGTGGSGTGGNGMGGSGTGGNGMGGSGTGGNGTGGNGTGGRFVNDSGLDAPCGATAIASHKVNVNIVLVVDKSGSMAANLTGTMTPKWDALTTALTTVLNDTSTDIDYGMDLYPVGGDCSVPTDPTLTVPVEDGTTGVPKIVAALQGVTPSGNTPTAKALQRALDYYKTGPGSTLTGDKYVLLATDGGPNCSENTALTCTAMTCTANLDGVCGELPTGNNCCTGGATDQCLDNVNTEAKITALADAGVKTFVVGLPGSDPYVTYLNSFAVAGGEALAGTTKYYAVTNATDLTAKFQAITTQLITSCRLQLTSDPEDTSLLNVSINGGDYIPKGSDTWTLDTTTSPPTIELLGSTCTMAETTGLDSVAIVYGCPTIMIR